MIGRREILRRVVLGSAAAMTLGIVPAQALDEAAATDHVRSTIDQVLALVAEGGSSESKAPALLSIMRSRAAMPQIARFAAGVVWREMNDDQQKRFTEAFENFLAVIYARRFQEYSGGVKQGADNYTVDGVINAGKKGLLVRTRIARPDGPPVLVEWLVTDQPGRVVIADIVIEGVSLLITQREEIGSMFEARGGDVEKLIADLSA